MNNNNPSTLDWKCKCGAEVTETNEARIVALTLKCPRCGYEPDPAEMRTELIRKEMDDIQDVYLNGYHPDSETEPDSNTE